METGGRIKADRGGSRRIEADMKDKQGLNVMDGLQAQ